MKSNFEQKNNSRDENLSLENNKSGDESKIRDQIGQKIDTSKFKSDFTDNYISEIKSNFRDKK